MAGPRRYRNLGGPQGLKYPAVPVNATIDMSKFSSHDYASGTTAWTLSKDEEWSSVLYATSASGAVQIVLTYPIPGKIYLVHNETGYTITFKVYGATGDTVINDKCALFYCNASDMVNAYTEALSATSPSNSPSNSPSTSASNSPSVSASNSPSNSPSASASNSPSASPSVSPSASPS